MLSRVRYAAMVHLMTFDEAVAAHAEFLGKIADEARQETLLAEYRGVKISYKSTASPISAAENKGNQRNKVTKLAASSALGYHCQSGKGSYTGNGPKIVPNTP